MKQPKLIQTHEEQIEHLVKTLESIEYGFMCASTAESRLNAHLYRGGKRKSVEGYHGAISFHNHDFDGSYQRHEGFYSTESLVVAMLKYAPFDEWVVWEA